MVLLLMFIGASRCLRTDRLDDAQGFGNREAVGTVDPYYVWKLPVGLTETQVNGSLHVDILGDVFPGIGMVSIPALVLPLPETTTLPLAVKASLSWSTDNSDNRMLVFFEADDGLATSDEPLSIDCRTVDDGNFTLPAFTIARLPESLTEFTSYRLYRETIQVAAKGEAVVLTISCSTIVYR